MMTWFRILSATLLAVFSLDSSASSPDVSACDLRKPLLTLSAEEVQARIQCTTVNWPDAKVLVGVDALGRVLLAVDHTRDGQADAFVMYTDDRRLHGPWDLWIDHASVTSSIGTLSIEASDRSFSLAVATQGYPTPTVGAKKLSGERTIVESDGVALIRQMLPADANKKPMSSISVEAKDEWPRSFAADLLAARNP